MLLESHGWVCAAPPQPLAVRKRPSRPSVTSVFNQDSRYVRRLKIGKTFSPADDRIQDSSGDSDANGGTGGYGDVRSGREEVLDGGVWRWD